MDQLRAELNNIKSFLTVYNRITEICFKACVDNLSNRRLDPDETVCVDNCFRKFSSSNQRLLSVYVKEQAVINQRRTEELLKMEQEARLKQQEQLQQEQVVQAEATPAVETVS